MSNCKLIKNYLDGSTVTSEEKPELLKHIKGCTRCHSEIESHGLEYLDIVLMLLAEEKMTDDPPHDASYLEAKEKNHRSIVRRLNIRSSQPSIENRVFDFIKNLIQPKILTPAILATGLLTVASPFFWHDQKSVNMLPESFRSKSEQQQNISLSIYDYKTRKEIEYNDNLKTNDIVFFRYSLKSGAYFSLIHYHKKEIKIMKNPSLEGKGQSIIKDLGWEFKKPGEHYFIALASQYPSISGLTETLKTKGIAALLKNKNFEGEIKKIVIKNS